jgi:hypothetical protein
MYKMRCANPIPVVESTVGKNVRLIPCVAVEKDPENSKHEPVRRRKVLRKLAFLPVVSP